MLVAWGLVAVGVGAIASRPLGQDPRVEPAKTASKPAEPTPNLDVAKEAEPMPPAQRTFSFVTPAGGEKVWTYDSASKQWRVYNAPPGIRFNLAFMGGGMGGGPTTPRLPQAITDPSVTIALGIEGQDIREIAAFHTKTATWSRQTLKVPAHSLVMPHVGRSLAIYCIGRYVYGFSDLTGTWDVRDLGEATEKAEKERNVAPMVSIPGGPTGMAEVGKKLCAFSALTGTWDIIDVEPVPTGPHLMRMFTVAGVEHLPIGNRLVFFDPERGKFRDVDAAAMPAPPRP
jgi:hypothetical protein